MKWQAESSTPLKLCFPSLFLPQVDQVEFKWFKSKYLETSLVILHCPAQSTHCFLKLAHQLPLQGKNVRGFLSRGGASVLASLLLRSSDCYSGKYSVFYCLFGLDPLTSLWQLKQLLTRGMRSEFPGLEIADPFPQCSLCHEVNGESQFPLTFTVFICFLPSPHSPHEPPILEQLQRTYLDQW